MIVMSTLPHNMASDVTLAPVMIPEAIDRRIDGGPYAKRWTREEYYRLGELGWFQNERVELVDGEILVMSPQSPKHYLALDRIYRCLEKVFGQEYWIRSQGPVTKGEFNEPEPDICVVKGPPEKYEDDHPSSAYLVIEVSKTSLRFDKTTKQSLYASMAVPDYWVLDLENRQLFVYRQPTADASVPFGHRYQQVETLSADSQVSPLEKPDSQIAIADMLPPQK